MADTDRLGEILENVSANVHDRKARQDIIWLGTTIGELRRGIKALAQAMGIGANQTPQIIIARAIGSLRSQAKELAEIHDLLAEALGYHKDVEDDPNSPCPGAYVTGEHTSVTLAMEAARKLKNSRLAEGNLGRSVDRAIDHVEELERELAQYRQEAREAQYASNGGTIESQELFELQRELTARKRVCSCPYWADVDRLMPSPNCPTHGVEAHNKKMQGERVIQELQTLRRILLGKADD